MRIFGLQPDQVLGRMPAGNRRANAPVSFAISYGAVSFGLVSVLAYSVWAYRLIEGTAAMYSAVAAIYIGLTGVALSRLVIGRGASGRFALLFAVAFLLYAVAWCAFWFGLKGKHHADLWGSVVGLAALTWLLQRAFDKKDDFLALFGVLFAFHTMGYYLGESLYATVRGSTGRLLWGAAHGVGFGAGIGYVVFRCQEPLMIRLRSTHPA